MEITKPDQLTGQVIKQMREGSGKTQTEFWGPIGVSKSRGSGYERGTHGVDEPVQLLVYLHHVCGVPVNLPHEYMAAMGQVAQGVGLGITAIEKATAEALAAINNLKSAKALLGA